MSTFLQLAHVSDLHLGDSLYPPEHWTGWVPGLEVHDPRVVTALSHAMRLEHIQSTVPQHLIATGDLTTWGNTAAFQTALTYIRSRFFVGEPHRWVGLNTPHASVIPGNHDMWGGAFPGRSLVTGTPPSTRANFIQFFSQPSPLAVYLNADKPFPYQLRLTQGPVAVYLYGLDSTEVHAAPYPRWRNFLADGHVSQQQLRDLETLVHNEQPEPRIRVAALHHPLVYSRTTGAPWWGTLINLDSAVLPTLQRLGFSIALCGHQHAGFVRQTSTTDTTCAPIWVFAVGTSTQRVRLSRDEQRLLRDPYSSLHPDQQQAWSAAAQRCNEYRLYDLACDPQVPTQLLVTIHSYRFNPQQFAFVKNPHPLRLKIDVGVF